MEKRLEDCSSAVGTLYYFFTASRSRIGLGIGEITDRRHFGIASCIFLVPVQQLFDCVSQSPSQELLRIP